MRNRQSGRRIGAGGGALWAAALFLIFVAVSPAAADAEPVDLAEWNPESYPAVDGFGAGVWQLSGDGLSVTQTVNGQPTIFYSDFDAFKTEVQGVIRVNTTADDDFIGFVLGFQPGDTSNSDAEYLLVDWKKATQTFNFGAPSCTPGTTGLVGLAVSRVFGVPTADELWGHVNFDVPGCQDADNGVEELARANTLGSTGWVSSTDYTFTFQFTATQLRIFVNDVLEFELEGEFSDGRFGFYNFSQAQVQYAAFTVADFNSPPVAQDDLYEVLAGNVLEVSVEAGVLANDEDPDLDELTAVLNSGPSNGILVLNPDGSFTYTPDAGFRGNDTFTYVADDGELQSDPATVTIAVLNNPPIADAGEDQTVFVGDLVTLDGTQSLDPDGDVLAFSWEILSFSGPEITLAGGTTATPSFTAIGEGTYTFRLTVDDGEGGSDADDVTITVLEPASLTIEDVLAFFDEAIANGDLVGSGPGGSAAGRLGALRNMLVEAGVLIDAGDIAAACGQLQQALNRANGTSPPPDFVQGPAAGELATMIEELMDQLGC